VLPMALDDEALDSVGCTYNVPRELGSSPAERP
jgi:hypothetical protein